MVDKLALSAREVGQILGLNHQTVRNLCFEGKIPYIKTSNTKKGRLIIPKKALYEWLETESRKSKLKPPTE